MSVVLRASGTTDAFAAFIDAMRAHELAPVTESSMRLMEARRYITPRFRSDYPPTTKYRYRIEAKSDIDAVLVKLIGVGMGLEFDG
jgi:hypothetical protein